MFPKYGDYWNTIIYYGILYLISIFYFLDIDFLYVQMQMGFKWIFVLSLALLQAAYYRRMKWSVLKSRKLVLDVVN
jgi:hypothetical protein